MPTNERRLKAKLVELGYDYEYCAKALGISKTTFAKKINNIDKFSIPQANELANLLKLTEDEKLIIFFS